MFNYIKKFFKFLFILLVILFFSALGYYQYQKMKQSGSIDKLLGNDTNYSSSSQNNDTGSNQNDSKSDTSDKNSSTSSGESLIKNNNYDEYYNKFNFDNVLLLYEGEQESSSTIEVLDRLIKNADDPLYTKPTVTFQNFNNLSNNEITENDLEEYKRVLNEAKNSLGNNKYIISFEYNKIKAIVNKIIITKN